MMKKTSALLALLLIPCLLLVTGCSDDDDDGDTTTSASAKANIVDTAIAAGNFNTLVTAVTEAGLAGALSGEGPLTVFAPTDDAFAKLPAGTLESLLADKAALASILKYHVVPGEFDGAHVLESASLPTLNGKGLFPTLNGETPRINNATIIATDIRASNGIIHAIDTVLIP